MSLPFPSNFVASFSCFVSSFLQGRGGSGYGPRALRIRYCLLRVGWGDKWMFTIQDSLAIGRLISNIYHKFIEKEAPIISVHSFPAQMEREVGNNH